MQSSLEILFADRHFIAVNKPARVGVGSDDSGDETLLSVVRHWNSQRQEEGRKGYCVPIHFLDRPVSGVIVFALSSKAAARLNTQFRDRSIGKHYAALVEGVPSEPNGTLEHWLVKDRNNNETRVTHAKHPDAKLSRLSYQTLAVNDGRAFLLVKPETGRSHQIRVQLAAMGTPIWGDVKYGASQSWDGRIALHAWHLYLKHPVGNAALHLTAPFPSYWQEVWRAAFPRSPEHTKETP